MDKLRLQFNHLPQGPLVYGFGVTSKQGIMKTSQWEYSYDNNIYVSFKTIVRNATAEQPVMHGRWQGPKGSIDYKPEHSDGIWHWLQRREWFRLHSSVDINHGESAFNDFEHMYPPSPSSSSSSSTSPSPPLAQFPLNSPEFQKLL